MNSNRKSEFRSQNPVRRKGTGLCGGPATGPQSLIPGFTLIELLVVIAVIAVMVAILLPSMRKIREAGRRTVCVSNLRQLQMAWQVYADNNGDRIVNGISQPRQIVEGKTTGDSKPWLIGVALRLDRYLTREEWIAAMKTGALWPYVGTIKAYECVMPVVPARPIWTLWQPYSIVWSMNCLLPLAWPGYPPRWAGKTVLLVRKTTEITSPSPASRMVFMDTYTQGSGFYIPYSQESWPVPDPPVHHSNGTVASFADGHSQAWRWQDKETIDCGLVWIEYLRTSNPDLLAALPRDLVNEDLYRIQAAVWGRLGYTPTRR